MRNTLLNTVIFIFSLNISIHSQDGTLDKTFGNDGYFKINSPDGFYGGCTGIAVDSSNNIFSIGYNYMEINKKENEIVVKLLQNGIPDVTFGDNGIVILPNDLGESKKIVVQNDGKIIVISNNNYNTINIIRLKPDGSFDSSFADNGVFKISGEKYLRTSPTSIFLYKNHILIGGRISSNPVIFKLEQNGTLDSTFGNNGFLYLSSSSGTVIDFLVDNKDMLYSAYCSGEETIRPDNTSIMLTRLDLHGNLDITFGKNGLVKLDEIFGSGSGELKTVNNSLYLSVNSSGEVGGFDTLLAKINMDGTMDTSFSDDGLFGHSYRSPYSFLVLNNNKILSGGFLQSDISKVLFKLDQYGEFDNSFGKNGFIRDMPVTLSEFRFQGSKNFLIGGTMDDHNNRPYTISRYSISNPDLSINKYNLENFKMFPNPTKSTFKIYSDAPVEQISIYDISGKHIINYSKSDSYNISKLKNGLYFLKVKFQNGNTIFKKITKK